jgi:hypothetical protein
VAVADAPAATPAMQAPAAGDLPEDAFPMKTLERYQTVAARPSLLARLAGKLKFRQRTELA